MDELTLERFLAPRPPSPRPPYPYVLVAERQRVLLEAMRGAARDPSTHRAPRAGE